MQVSLQHYNVFSWKICEFTSFPLVERWRLCCVLPLARVLIELLCFCNKFFRKMLHLNRSVKWGKKNLFINRLLLHWFRIWSHNQDTTNLLHYKWPDYNESFFPPKPVLFLLQLRANIPIQRLTVLIQYHLAYGLFTDGAPVWCRVKSHLTLMFMTLSYWAMSVDSMLPMARMPALLTSTSSRP